MDSKQNDEICCNSCQKGCYTKILDSIDKGVVIYRQTAESETQKNKVTTEDIFVLHNVRDKSNDTADLINTIKKYKLNCPKCQWLVENAQKSNRASGVCDHCIQRAKTSVCCDECEHIVKKFLALLDRLNETDAADVHYKKIQDVLKGILRDELGKTGIRPWSAILGRDEKRSIFYPTVEPSTLVDQRGFYRTGEPPSTSSKYPTESGRYRTEAMPPCTAHLPGAAPIYREISATEQATDFSGLFGSRSKSKQAHDALLHFAKKKAKRIDQGKSSFAVKDYLEEGSISPRGAYSDDEIYKDKKQQAGASAIRKKEKAVESVGKRRHSVESLASKKSDGKSNLDQIVDTKEKRADTIGPLPQRKIAEKLSKQHIAGVGSEGVSNKKTQITKDMKSLDKSIERVTKPPEREGKLPEKQAKPPEKLVKSPEKEAKPQQREIKPPEKQVKPTEKQVKPTEKGAKPSDKEAKPSEKEAKPSGKEAKPPERELKPQDKDVKTIGKDGKSQKLTKDDKEKPAEDTKEMKERRAEADRLAVEREARLKERELRMQKDKQPKEKEEKVSKKPKGETKTKEKSKEDVTERKSKRSKMRLDITEVNVTDIKSKAISGDKEKISTNKSVYQQDLIKVSTVESDKKDEVDHGTIKVKEFNIKNIKMRPPSQDAMGFVIEDKHRSQPGRQDVHKKGLIDELSITEIIAMQKTHEGHLNSKPGDCLICHNSQFELDVASLLEHQRKEQLHIRQDMVIGENIICTRRYFPEVEKIKKEKAKLLYESTYFAEDIKNIPVLHPEEEESAARKWRDGVLRYQLSDPMFIDKGWTLLPTEKIVRRMNIYRMHPSQPEFDWFEHNKNKGFITYDDGERLAEFESDGSARWYYRNGRLALVYYNAEEQNASKRFIVYSYSKLDVCGRERPVTVLATFDFLGNGVVYDHDGKVRLKYNQTEGVILDKTLGPVSHWKWHSLNDPPVLQRVMIDTKLNFKEPGILRYASATGLPLEAEKSDEMLAIEFDNFVKEKSKKMNLKFKPFQIKMKALKINKHFSLKVLDQATIYLIYRDGSTNLKVNIGMVLDHKDIIDTDTADMANVANVLEKFPARSQSIEAMQRAVMQAQQLSKLCEKHQKWLMPQSKASFDVLTSGLSKPLRVPFMTKDCCMCEAKNQV